ncbi:MAG: tetratricopeptide repeat protein [Terriglobia bacterium]
MSAEKKRALAFGATPARCRFCPLIWFLAIACSLALAVSVLANTIPAASVGQLSAQAQQALSRNDYATAVTCYQKILKRHPNLAKVRVNLGLTYNLMVRYAEAVHEFESVLSQNPTLFTANLFLGLDLLHLHNPDKALFYLQRATSLRPHSAEAAAALAKDYQQMQRPAKAAAWFGRAVEATPQNADTWYGMGIAYLDLEEEATEKLGNRGTKSAYFQTLMADSEAKRGWLGAAIRTYQGLLSSGSPGLYLRSRMGFVYLQRNDLSQAEQQFQAELARHPGCLSAQLGEAGLDLDRGNPSQALQKIAHIAATDPGFFQANIPRLWLGWNPERVSAFETSLEHLQVRRGQRQTISSLVAAMERWKKEPLNVFVTFPGVRRAVTSGQVPSSRGAAENLYAQGHYTVCAQAVLSQSGGLRTNDLMLLSRCSYYAGEFQLTLQASERMLALYPRSQAALFWEAKASEVLAVASLAHVGLLQPDSARTHFLLGKAYEWQGNFKEARDEYRKSVHVDPQNPAGYLALAALDVNNMEFRQALPELQIVLARNPDDPAANFLMSEILIYQHQYEKSLRCLKAALRGPASSLGRVHALIGKVYAAEGHTRDAIVELNQGLAADDDGSLHYQLFLLYRKLGQTAAAAAALRDSEAIRKERAAKLHNLITSTP